MRPCRSSCTPRTRTLFATLTVLGLLGAAWSTGVAGITAGRIVTGVVTLSARALDENRPFDMVLFFVDDECIYTTNAEPYSYDWDTRAFAAGRHLLRVEAYRHSVRIARSPSHAVIVSNDLANSGRGDTPVIELRFSTSPSLRPEAAPALPPPLARAATPAVAKSRRAVVSRTAPLTLAARVPATRGAVRKLPATVAASSEGAVHLFIDGKELPLGALTLGADPSVLYLPARATFARLGAPGAWYDETRTFFARHADKKIWLTAGESCVRVNRVPLELEAPVRLEAQGLMIPVGTCRQAFDLHVVWMHESRRVELFTNREPPTAPLGSPISLLFRLLGWA